MITRFLILVTVCLSTALTRGQEPGSVFHNRGSLTNQPPIMADIFINDGLFEVQNLLLAAIPQNFVDPSLTPYDLSYNRYFTNNGTFQGLSVRFEYIDD